MLTTLPSSFAFNSTSGTDLLELDEENNSHLICNLKIAAKSLEWDDD